MKSSRLQPPNLKAAPNPKSQIPVRSAGWAVWSVLFLWSLKLGSFSLGVLQAADEPQPFGIDRRIPWTTSRVVGSPDPPLPYTVERTFTNVPWKAPIFLTPEPDSDRLLVVQQGGEEGRPSKILRVRDVPNTDQVETLLEVSNRLVYSVTFHPAYHTNGYLYVFSNGPTPNSERTNRISRFTVARQTPPRCDPLSEQVIIEWRSAGHDGGGIAFGPDAMLYLSTG